MYVNSIHNTPEPNRSVQTHFKTLTVDSKAVTLLSMSLSSCRDVSFRSLTASVSLSIFSSILCWSVSIRSIRSSLLSALASSSAILRDWSRGSLLVIVFTCRVYIVDGYFICVFFWFVSEEFECVWVFT